MKNIAFAALAMLFCSTQASALTLSPLPRVDMIDGVATLSVGNDDGHWRADLYKMRGTHMVPAVDAMVAPRIFRAPTIVRIATKKVPDGEREIFYRLVLTQQIKPSAGVQPRLSVSIPVVQSPRNSVSQYKCLGGSVANTGNTHLKIMHKDGILYVLPGVTAILPADATVDTGKAVCTHGELDEKK